MESLSYCIANSIDLTRLDQHYKTTQDGYVSVKSRDVLKLSAARNQNNILFVFKNGTVVSWGFKRYQMPHYLDTIKSFATRPISIPVHDEFSVRITDTTSIKPNDYFEVDSITLENDSEELKLSFSYGLSQSVKLQYFETTLDALVDKYTPFIHNLSHKGTLEIPRNQIRQIIGEIIGTKSEMNLISNFLHHPKYFWQHPTLEEYYSMLERYLHIQRRVNAINHRLNTLNEIFDMFNSYLDNRHAHSLEVIIIILIVIEIIFGVLNFHF